MNRQSVSSTDISSVGYDSGSQTLEIEFNSGGIYQYFNVPEDLYNNLVNASSCGRFFNQHIRGRYNDAKI